MKTDEQRRRANHAQKLKRDLRRKLKLCRDCGDPVDGNYVQCRVHRERASVLKKEGRKKHRTASPVHGDQMVDKDPNLVLPVLDNPTIIHPA